MDGLHYHAIVWRPCARRVEGSSTERIGQCDKAFALLPLQRLALPSTEQRRLLVLPMHAAQQARLALVNEGTV